MPILWSISDVRPKGPATRGLDTQVTTVGISLGVGTLMIGLASSFSRVSLAGLFRWHFIPLRVIRTSRMVRVTARVRVEVFRSWVLQAIVAILMLRADLRRVVMIVKRLITCLDVLLVWGGCTCSVGNMTSPNSSTSN